MDDDDSTKDWLIEGGQSPARASEPIGAEQLVPIDGASVSAESSDRGATRAGLIRLKLINCEWLERPGMTS
jgi:hypothetical protein